MEYQRYSILFIHYGSSAAQHSLKLFTILDYKIFSPKNHQIIFNQKGKILKVSQSITGYGNPLNTPKTYKLYVKQAVIWEG